MQHQPSQVSFKNRLGNFFGLGLELLSLMFFVRLVVDTSNRIFMPFIPQFSSGLGLTITAFSWLLALRSLMGLTSPVIGVLADRYGRRLVMILALVTRGFGLLGLGFSTGWWSALPMLVVSLSTTAYLPIQRAYVSDQVSYERRGRALAAVDASFSTAGMVGLPIIGWMIEIWGWQLPILMLAGLSFLAAMLAGLRLPKTENRTSSQPLQLIMWKYLRQPSILASVLVSILLLFIFILFMTFWALWLSVDYGLGPLEIGLMGTRVGIAEFTGLFLAGLFIDRIGKRRGSLWGLIVTTALFLFFLVFNKTLLSVQVMLVITALVFEFVLTAAIPLFAEQAPGARATVFSLVALGNTIGIGLGPPVTTSLWAWGGLKAVTIVASICSLLAFFLVWKYLRDHPDSPQAKDEGSVILVQTR